MDKFPEQQKKILDYFISDKEQLSVIKSDKSRFIVEAPAGYGKTKVLINKTLYDLFDNEPKNYEQVLMITFSINSTSKMREDIEKEIKYLPEEIKVKMRNKVKITNYHGLARQILSKYGVVINESMMGFKNFKVVDERQLFQKSFVSRSSKKIIQEYEEAIKTASQTHVLNEIESYNNVIMQEVIPNNFITYNAILTLTIKLLSENKQILEFYQRLYTKIVIDEFQDTNYLNYRLIELLITDENIKVQIYGDHLQRIYGFIGTIPNLFDIFSEQHNFDYFKLKTNYRFKDNKEMLLLDGRIRELATNPQSNLEQSVSENIVIYDTHHEEIINTVDKIQQLICDNSNKRVAVLVPQRGPDAEKLLVELKNKKINYYNALNIDVDEDDYKLFHSICADHFQEHFSANMRIIKSEMNKWYEKVYYDSKIQQLEDEIRTCYFKLLKAFLNTNVYDSSYRKKSQEEKYEFILDILLENELSRYLSAIDDNIQVLTIHSAKGIEWDEVFLMDVEEGKLPNWNGMCNICRYKSDCLLEVTIDNQDIFIEQLSLFYVGVTRARENVHISASRKCVKGFDKNISCIFRKLNTEYISVSKNMTRL